ncbi:hypothetical protein [uncultured Sphingorhabdus sp.]|uniref:hypothetical protein n=1 Tax=uncultured Sphingorhabdus sp. TaxID=1686106 RepID=UPI00260EC6C4|nr:hypothetical protein [uncultured Sphingorhabdus sp.]HMS20915.1 hypothetical protein [Sphingorhabdus sp.]
MRLVPLAISLLALVGASMPSFAEWKVLVADEGVNVAGKYIVATPKAGWNSSSARPSDYGERWTRDGLALNELTFFAAIPDGGTLYHASDGTNQTLPKFRSTMQPTEIVELFENSNRILLNSSVFSVEAIEPAKLGAHDGVRFAYSYAAQDEGLTRKGEGVAAIVEGKLYLVNFIAPEIHYFDRDIDEVRQLFATLQLRSPKTSKSR